MAGPRLPATRVAARTCGVDPAEAGTVDAFMHICAARRARVGDVPRSSGPTMKVLHEGRRRRARPGCSTAGGWPRTPSCPRPTARVDEAQAVLGLARAHAGGELERLLVRGDAGPVGADGRAGRPLTGSNRHQAPQGRPMSTPSARDGRPPRARTSTRSTSGSTRRRSSSCPAATSRGVARPRPHGRPAGRAPRRSAAAPPPSLVVPYLEPARRTCCGRWPAWQEPPTVRR